MAWLSLLFGSIVGLSLGLTGGGGAIFAVPLLAYGLGVPAREAVGISLDNGVETITESDDEAVTAKIQEHVAPMRERIDRQMNSLTSLYPERAREAQFHTQS